MMDKGYKKDTNQNLKNKNSAYINFHFWWQFFSY